MTITPLGSGQEVGRLCHLLEFRGMTIMLDCGIHPGYELSKRLATCQEVCTGCGTWCVEEIRKKEGCVVRKYKKQGCHRRFLFLLFSPAAAPKIPLKNPFAPHLRARHNTYARETTGSSTRILPTVSCSTEHPNPKIGTPHRIHDPAMHPASSIQCSMQYPESSLITFSFFVHRVFDTVISVIRMSREKKTRQMIKLQALFNLCIVAWFGFDLRVDSFGSKVPARKLSSVFPSASFSRTKTTTTTTRLLATREETIQWKLPSQIDDRDVQIVLVCGFESFNRELYTSAAQELGIKLSVFSDTDIRSGSGINDGIKPEFEEALKNADAFIGSLIFDYDDVLAVEKRLDQVKGPRFVFESATELMAFNKVGSFTMEPGEDGPAGPPPAVKAVLSKFSSGKEEDKINGMRLRNTVACVLGSRS
jgi:hypothetical protein